MPPASNTPLNISAPPPKDGPVEFHVVALPQEMMAQPEPKRLTLEASADLVLDDGSAVTSTMPSVDATTGPQPSAFYLAGPAPCFPLQRLATLSPEPERVGQC
eukprot:CAMPEP_0175952108 /NCGR_PEP_ID=MMETSP0108-20121206/30567_1 /TAXON_ID=195067 ORGANISM="Goniomonas pacifica, Strain CCMP1869" /NCGR_SAMPLE_ID=MMETSP0108 /ASSEMBLY_ACC=CAM_ASM_000204 /LENGTH=102 /DNA_ID=CAMNT_0017278431 /DNA_START=79 /DNA_END=387 /DNA_ORIENTATION=+